MCEMCVHVEIEKNVSLVLHMVVLLSPLLEILLLNRVWLHANTNSLGRGWGQLYHAPFHE
jgi:hypothetical protein